MSPWEAVRLAAPVLADSYAEVLTQAGAPRADAQLSSGLHREVTWECRGGKVTIATRITGEDAVTLTWAQVRKLLREHLAPEQVERIRYHRARWRTVWAAYCEREGGYHLAMTLAEHQLHSIRIRPFYRAGMNAHRVMRDYTRDVVLTAPTEPLDADPMGTPSLFGALA
ncbi:hypothetical protein [Serinibacter salmoneus]|uniref:Uncharacterized protein n=1 Tax=Serinibacter salmoneus TaxID=556530 RepID=A0A2A9CZH2_9MICO|nr:hypothetical protein [Serinibacter salmoneus]PFG19848.1 hypothetical protein ATL40_1424 [Serinibacter salmoneus]